MEKVSGTRWNIQPRLRIFPPSTRFRIALVKNIRSIKDGFNGGRKNRISALAVREKPARDIFTTLLTNAL
jgi:hypothetical protein